MGGILETGRGAQIGWERVIEGSGEAREGARRSLDASSVLIGVAFRLGSLGMSSERRSPHAAPAKQVEVAALSGGSARALIPRATLGRRQSGP